jgi:hypothetical protein
MIKILVAYRCFGAVHLNGELAIGIPPSSFNGSRVDGSSAKETLE